MEIQQESTQAQLKSNLNRNNIQRKSNKTCKNTVEIKTYPHKSNKYQTEIQQRLPANPTQNQRECSIWQRKVQQSNANPTKSTKSNKNPSKPQARFMNNPN